MANQFKKLVPDGSDEFAGLVDGSIVNFKMPKGKTSVKEYLCQSLTSLESVDLTGCTGVGSYAFNETRNVKNVTGLNDLASVGNYAFAYFGYSHSGTSEFDVNTTSCTVSSYAFYYSAIRKLSGKIHTSGSCSFLHCHRLKEVDIEVGLNLQDNTFESDDNLEKLKIKLADNAGIGVSCFKSCTKVSEVDFSECKPISVGSSAFSRFGRNRISPESNILEIPFQNSRLSTIYANAFEDTIYMVYRFPATLTTINNNAFATTDHCDFYFYSETAPRLSGTATWNGASNYNIFVPYNSVNAYRTATNWAAQANYIKGFASEDTFEVGETLPTVNDEGCGLTWYTDKSCTTSATVATGTELYVVVGTEKIAFKVKALAAIDCSLAVTDGAKTYTVGDTVMKNTVLTITGTATTAGYTPYIFTVNGQDFTSGNTVTVTSDISVTAIYWNGHDVPLNPVFADNAWQMIALGLKTGAGANLWNVGDTKQITSKSGITYTIRLCDLQAGRYDYADGSGTTHGVLEFVELYKLGSTNTWKMNTSSTNTGGWAQSYMRNTVMPSIEADLPDDLVSALASVNVLSGTGGGTSSGISSSSNKLFLPAEMEMFSTRTYSIGNSECPLGQFDYYKTHNTNADRVKRNVGTTNAYYYWQRSPRSGISYYFCYVSSDGSANDSSATSSYGVAPCFAF